MRCAAARFEGDGMKIAEVSKRYGVSTDTLRYYERIGLLRHVPRNKSGIRDYDEASCNAVEFVKCMRDAGMSIESLVEYMELLEQGDETTAARKELLLRQATRSGSALPAWSGPWRVSEYQDRALRRGHDGHRADSARGGVTAANAFVPWALPSSLLLELTPTFIMAFRETN